MRSRTASPSSAAGQSPCGDWLDGGCTEWGVDAVKELEEQDADGEPSGCQAVGLGLRDFDDQALGT